MLPQSIIDKILAKYGKEQIFSADCAPIHNNNIIGGYLAAKDEGLTSMENIV